MEDGANATPRHDVAWDGRDRLGNMSEAADLLYGLGLDLAAEWCCELSDWSTSVVGELEALGWRGKCGRY